MTLHESHRQLRFSTTLFEAPNQMQVCIFDADQLANSDFYIKTVPLFDLGDDVGMVLSPQAFHNLRLHADIFNHANIHFWEYSQPGYDALGFISCTGASPPPFPGLSLEHWKLFWQVA